MRKIVKKMIEAQEMMSELMDMPLSDLQREAMKMSAKLLAEQEALLIEALARLEALDHMVGDFGGPFHVEELEDMVHSVTWIGAMHSEPPDWERLEDPLDANADDDGVDPLNDLWDDVEARAIVLRDRLRREHVAYHERAEKSHPREKKWRPWWRTNWPVRESGGK